MGIQIMCHQASFSTPVDHVKSHRDFLHDGLSSTCSYKLSKDALIPTITESVYLAVNNLFFSFPFIFPSAFFRELQLHIMCPKWDHLSVVICGLSKNAGLVCSIIHWFVFLTVQSIFRSLLWYQSSNE